MVAGLLTHRPRAHSLMGRADIRSGAAGMIIDFQQHYTPPEMLKGDPEVADRPGGRARQPELPAQPAARRPFRPCEDDGPCRHRRRRAVLRRRLRPARSRRSAGRSTTAWRRPRRTIPGRFIGLAHVPALKPDEARAELKRCAVDLGFPGVVIASEMQDQALDAEALAAVLEGLLRSRALRVHPSAGAASSTGTGWTPTTSAACSAGSSR